MNFYNYEKDNHLDQLLRISVLLFLITILICNIFNSNWFKRIQLAFTLPGPPALPIIGNAHIATDSDKIMELGTNAYECYGSVFRVWVSVHPLFVLLEPKDVQTVLSSTKHAEKTFFYSFMHNFLGNGLITTSGEMWRVHRKLLQPSFHINILESFIGTFSDRANSLVQKIEQSTMNSPDINIAPFINNSVFDILTEAVLGIPIDQDGNSYQASPFRQGKVVTLERVVQPWLLLNCFYKMTKSAKNENNQKENLNVFTRKIIESKREEKKNGICKNKRISLLERMLDISEEHPEFSDDDILNEVCTFMLAGQESVATTISFCLYFIAKHQDVQTRICEELHKVFGDSTRVSNMADLQEMKYLEQCIKETLRLCPSVPVISRILGENIQIGKYTLPAGSNILISSFIIHHLKNIYPNPDKFDPERFTSVECEKRPNFSFIPFSAGPRNCIGYKFAMLEMKTVISSILRNFQLTVKPDYEIQFSFRITMRAKGGVWLRVKQRS